MSAGVYAWLETSATEINDPNSFYDRLESFWVVPPLPLVQHPYANIFFFNGLGYNGAGGPVILQPTLDIYGPSGWELINTYVIGTVPTQSSKIGHPFPGDVIRGVITMTGLYPTKYDIEWDDETPGHIDSDIVHWQGQGELAGAIFNEAYPGVFEAYDAAVGDTSFVCDNLPSASTNTGSAPVKFYNISMNKGTVANWNLQQALSPGYQLETFGPGAVPDCTYAITTSGQAPKDVELSWCIPIGEQCVRGNTIQSDCCSPNDCVVFGPPLNPHGLCTAPGQ